MTTGSEPDPLATFDTAPLRRAAARVARSLAYAQSDLALSDVEIREEFMQSAIQAFEYTFELAVKSLERFLRLVRIATVEYRPTYNELIRFGIADGLIIGELRDWIVFRERRNITSHTYNAEKAAAVYRIIPEFLAQAEALRSAMDARIAKLQ